MIMNLCLNSTKNLLSTFFARISSAKFPFYYHSCALSYRYTNHIQNNLKDISNKRSYSIINIPDAGIKFNITRGSYSEITSEDIEYFNGVLKEDKLGYTQTGVILFDDDNNDNEEFDKYNVDWLNLGRGDSKVILKPKTTEQVSKILEYCNNRKLAVVPQGGNTSLVAGAIPVFDEIVISMERMNQIINIDQISGTVVVEAGCVLAILDELLNEKNLMVPLDLGSKGSCQIGGNISTNAGGLRLLRYGSIHGNILGITAVLADGSIVDTLSPLRKDNTGYDLKQLFVGSEGTLGIITNASLICPPLPSSINVALLGSDSFKNVCRILKLARLMLAETLSAFEFMDNESMNCCTTNLYLKCPIEQDCKFYVLIEISGSNDEHNSEKLNDFLHQVIDSCLAEGGTQGTDIGKIRSIWKIRESMAEALIRDGYNYKYDVSVPLDNFYDLVEVMRKRLDGKVTRVASYGHLGDGNLHLNATTPAYSPEVANLIEPFLYEYVQSCKGSISAEHGIGLMKSKYLKYSKSEVCINLMRKMKTTFDPNAILNPYKILADE